jgi:hypothetical protein
MISEPRNGQIIFLIFNFKYFHNYKLFSHVYRLHALIYDLKFIFKLKFLKIVLKFYP